MYSKKIEKSLIKVVALMVIWVLLAGVVQAQPARKVLVLDSFHQGFSWSDEIVEAIRSELGGSSLDVDLFFEYMDTKRCNPDRAFGYLRELYKSKYSGVQLDLIICSYNNSFAFLLQYGKELFPNVPVVFCGVDKFKDSMLEGRDSITGILQPNDYESTVEVALKLHPSVRRVIIVGDETLGWFDAWKEDFAGLSRKFSERAEFVSFELSQLSTDEFLQELERLRNGSVMVLVALFENPIGELYDLDGATALLRQRCDIPIYVIWEPWLGHDGIVGGDVINPTNQGRAGAKMAIRILNGQSVRDIPIVRESPDRCMFDYVQMKHFGISFANLPEGSVIINEPESFYYKYRAQIWAVTAIILGLTTVVMILSVSIIRRKRAEQKLKRYQFMVESAHDAIFFKDLESRYIIANNKALEAFGLSREQVIGKNDHEIMPNKDQAGKNIEDDQLVFKTGRLTEITRQMTGADGKERWFQAIKAPQFDDKGNTIGLVGIARDVTEHRQAEETLRESEERLRLILEHSGDGINIAEFDPKTHKRRLILCNDRYVEIAGRSKEQLMAADNLDEFIQNHGTAEELQQSRERLLQGHTCRGLSSWIRPDGKENYYEWTAAPIRAGNKVYIVGIDRDITEQKQTEKALARERNLLRVLVDTLPDVIFLKDTNSAFVFGNLGCARQLKAETPEAIIGRTDFDFMPQELAERWYTEEQEIIRTGQPVLNSEICVEDESGRLRKWLSSTKLPWRDDNGNIVGIVGLNYNITERKKAEKRLAKVNECFLSFGADPVENIQLLTAMCGEQLEASCALYNHLEDGMLCSTGCWNVPSDYKPVDKAEGHICFDVIRKSKDDIFIVRNLPETTYFHTDPNVAAYGLKTYIGKAVKCRGKYVGSVCVVYKDDIELSRDDERLLEIVASAIGVEEERKQAEDALQRIRDELEVRVKQRTAELARANEELRNEIGERKKTEEKLLSYQNQLRSLASELSLAEERLRRRIATDVHDHIGQNLAISKIKLDSLAEAISSSELSKDLDEIRDLVAQTIESTRSLTFELSPPVLYELGFEPAMKWLVRETRQRYGLSTEFTDDGQSKPLDNNIRVLLFQAVRELLVNVVKHAQARNVTVSTRRAGDEICVSVEDDGVGFNVSESGSHEYRTGGFGLFSIRERLGYIGGHLDVESRVGKGTRVTLTAPINQEKEKNKGKQK